MLRQCVLSLTAALLLSASPFIVTVADAAPVLPPAHHEHMLVPPHIRDANELESISARFDVDYEMVREYYRAGWKFNELRHAAFLSFAANKPMGDILKLALDNTWPRVEYKLGLTPNDIKAAHDRCDASYISKKLNAEYNAAYALLAQNYSFGDVAHAVLLAQYSNRSAEEIIALHNPPAADWDTVAVQLGISADTMTQVREKLFDVRP